MRSASRSVRALEREIDPNAVLGLAGLPAARSEPRHGWTNRAWVGDSYVVRVSSGRLEGSLAHERKIIDLLRSSGIPVAPVVASGLVDDLPAHRDEAGEWLVSRRLPGDTMASAWPRLDPARRSRVGRMLGSLMRSLHHVPVATSAPRWWIDAHESPLLRNAYRPRVTLGPALVEAARELPDADQGLLDETAALFDERIGLFASDTEVLVHGDLYGHNILVTMTPSGVSGLLDWEGARTAPADVELDMFLRWATAADDFPQSPGAPSSIRRGDCLELIDHVAVSYPELFAIPNLKARLEVYDALWHLVQLLLDGYWRANDPSATDGRSPTWDRLRALLEGRGPVASLPL